VSRPLTLTQLMQRMAARQKGAPDTGYFLATSPDQVERRKNRGGTVIERVEASVAIACTRPNKFSEFAVTEHGEIWRVEDLMNEQGWSRKHAQKGITEAVRAGVIQRGTVTVRQPGGGEADEQAIFWSYLIKNKSFKRMKESKEVDNNGACTSAVLFFFAPQELTQIRRFNAERQALAEKLAEEFPKVADKAFAEAAALVRRAIEQQKYSAKRALGIKLKPKQLKVKEEPRFVKLSLLADLFPELGTGAGNGLSAGSVGRSVPPVDLPTDSSKGLTSNTLLEGACTEAILGPVQVPADFVHAPADRESVHDLLVRLLGPKIHDDPSPALCDRIVRNMRGAPLEHLEIRIGLRYRSIMSMGMVEGLALDVGKAWSKLEAARQKGEQVYQARVEQQRAESEAQIRTHFAAADATERAWMLEHFPELRELAKAVGGES
jgi:hypothetical protein